MSVLLVWVFFCWHVCKWTTCVQFSWRPGESLRSPGPGAAGMWVMSFLQDQPYLLSHLSRCLVYSFVSLSTCAPAIACVCGWRGWGQRAAGRSQLSLSCTCVPRTELGPQSRQQAPLPDELLASLTFFPFFFLLPTLLLWQGLPL